jgi:outer membrane protein assembly factor BamB
MRERRLVSLFLLIFWGALTLTGCGGGLPAVSWFGVAASEDTVYLAANEQVFALDLESGVEKWAFPPQPDRERGPFYATPLLTNDALVVGGFTNDGELYAISQDSGTQEWVVETEGRIVEGAVSVDGGVVVGNNEGEVYLVEIETREKRALLKAEKPIWATPLVDEVNGRAYIASMDHHLYAVHLESGEQLWAFKVGGALAGTPALGDGMLYFGALDSTIYAIDADTATELWHFRTKGWVWGGPLVHEGTVYCGDMAGYLYALDATDGSERWPAFEAEGGVRAKPLLAGDLLYFGTRQGKVYAVKAEDGTQQWALPLTGAIYGRPVLRGDYLLVAPHNAKVKLVALNAESGVERWSYPRREE